MAVADHIHLDLALLADLRQKCWQIGAALGNSMYQGNEVESAPEVSDALDAFQGRWDDARLDVMEGVGQLAEAFTVIEDSFREMDRRLAEALGPGAAS